jgi:hypothetical protein
MRTFRRHLIALIAVLCLLGVQQGAALHEMSHLSGDGSASHEKHAPGSKVCDKCASYAEVSGAGLPAAPLAFHVQASALDSLPTAAQFFPSTTVSAYAARAPPFYL